MPFRKSINIPNANHTLYELGQKKGHYESHFMRANHPKEPKAKVLVSSPMARFDGGLKVDDTPIVKLE